MKQLTKITLLLLVSILAFSCGEDPVDPQTAANDTTPPTITITTSANGAAISQNFVIQADAQDAESSVVQIKFYIDGVQSGMTKSGVLGDTGLHTYTSDQVNINTLADGQEYTISAVAYNGKGMTTTNQIIITVNKGQTPQKPVVTITAPATGNVSNTIQIVATATVSGSSISQVLFYNGTELLSSSDSDPYTSGSINTTLYPNTTVLTLKAVATAANGLVTTNTRQVTVINPVADTTAPSLSITSPANGEIVSGNLVIGASSADAESGVSGVSFYFKNALVNTDTLSAYQSSAIDTTTLSNGAYTIEVVSENGVGLTTTNSITVTVDNGSGNSDLTLSLVDIADDFDVPMFGTQWISTGEPTIKWVNPIPVTGIQSFIVEVWDATGENILWSVINLDPSTSQLGYGIAPVNSQIYPEDDAAPSLLAPNDTYQVHVTAYDNQESFSGTEVGIAHTLAATSDFTRSRHAASAPRKTITRDQYLKLIARLKK